MSYYRVDNKRYDYFSEADKAARQIVLEGNDATTVVLDKFSGLNERGGPLWEPQHIYAWSKNGQRIVRSLISRGGDR